MMDDSPQDELPIDEGKPIDEGGTIDAGNRSRKGETGRPAYACVTAHCRREARISVASRGWTASAK